jgi:hypothetical protein
VPSKTKKVFIYLEHTRSGEITIVSPANDIRQIEFKERKIVFDYDQAICRCVGQDLEEKVSCSVIPTNCHPPKKTTIEVLYIFFSSYYKREMAFMIIFLFE